MNIYKVYIKDNIEHFQIWNNTEDELISEYHDFFTRALCDYAFLQEDTIKKSGELIISAYQYMNAVSNKIITDVQPPHRELLNISPIYMFLQDQKQSFYDEGLNPEYLNSTWFDYPKDDKGKISDIEINKILLSEYSCIKSYFNKVLNEEKATNINWGRTLNTKIENIDGISCQVLYPTHTSDVVYFLFLEMFKSDILFKVCKRCERIFPCFYHKNVQFCERLDLYVKETCRQIKFSHDYIEYDPNGDSTKQMILDIYNRAYRRQRRRVDHDSLTVVKFKIWSKKARKQRDLCLKRKITINEFEEWIKENDKNYDEED